MREKVAQIQDIYRTDPKGADVIKGELAKQGNPRSF
jgi:hypothetical protein